MGFSQHRCQLGPLAQLQGLRGLPWPPVPLAQAGLTLGGCWSLLPTWGTAGHWTEVPGGNVGRAPRVRVPQGDVPAHPFPLLQVNIRLWCLRAAGLPSVTACPPFPPSPGGHWRSVPAAAGPRQCGQMSSVSTGGELSVGITADGCSSVRCSAHEPCASWGPWSPAWPGGPSRVVSQLSRLCS